MLTRQVKYDPRMSRAIREKDIQSVRSIVREDPEQVFAVTPFRSASWLHYAAGEGDLAIVDFLLSQGLDVNEGDVRDGRTALCDACDSAHPEVARFLINRGAQFDVSEPIVNPLFSAIIGRSLEAVIILLDANIDIDARYTGSSMKDMDAIAFAMERGEVEIAREIANRKVGNDPSLIEAEVQKGFEIARSNNSR